MGINIIMWAVNLFYILETQNWDAGKKLNKLNILV